MNAAQIPLFGLDAGRALRDSGLERVEAHSDGWVDQARRIAATFCYAKHTVTTDDLQRCLTLPEGLHHNAWGSVLKYPYFEKTGRLIQSTRPEAHARWIHVWRLGPKSAPLTARTAPNGLGNPDPSGDSGGERQ